MKEVIKCSISGVAFTLDTDAYQTLKEYLDTLKKSYKESPDGAEIVADIEARIAELILSVQENTHIVEKPLIQNIIKQMGTPEDISDNNSEEGAEIGESRFPRRLYRDTENAKLGGVCAGIGRYFDIDPVWIRMGLFTPILLSMLSWVPFMHWTASIMGNLFGIFVVCYLIMWFAVPIARTARQRLEMTGERITTQSIREASSTSGNNDADHKAKPIVAEAVSVFGKIVLLFMKILLGFMVFGLIIAACALIIGLFAVIISGPEIFNFAIPSLWVPILGIFIALIPIGMLIYVFMCMIASRKPNGKTILVIFLFWLASIISCTSMAIREHFGEQVFGDEGIITLIERINASDSSQIETYFGDDNKSLHLQMPDKQIDILVGEGSASIQVNDATEITNCIDGKTKSLPEAGTDVAPKKGGETNND